jgi:hypothetical protein
VNRQAGRQAGDWQEGRQGQNESMVMMPAEHAQQQLPKSGCNALLGDLRNKQWEASQIHRRVPLTRHGAKYWLHWSHAKSLSTSAPCCCCCCCLSG